MLSSIDFLVTLHFLSISPRLLLKLSLLGESNKKHAIKLTINKKLT